MSVLLLFFSPLAPLCARTAPAAERDDIHLELSPRICTLGVNDKQCDTRARGIAPPLQGPRSGEWQTCGVRRSRIWRAPGDESLCLVIESRPDVKRCWEKYSEGTYSIKLIFSTDLVVQLKDLDLQQVLASEVLRVIREAIRYRHKRREPWNIFD